MGQGDWPLGDSRKNIPIPFILQPFNPVLCFKICNDAISLQFKPWICPSRLWIHELMTPLTDNLGSSFLARVAASSSQLHPAAFGALPYTSLLHTRSCHHLLFLYSVSCLGFFRVVLAFPKKTTTLFSMRRSLSTLRYQQVLLSFDGC